MPRIFDIKCRNCGASVGYDIVKGTYRCPHCGEITGIQEVRDQEAAFRRLDREDRTRIRSVREVLSCPNCGAELLYDESEESQICSFCGGTLLRREFEESRDFPAYIIPFVLTEDEAKKELLDWAKAHKNLPEAGLIRDRAEDLEGYYLPYDVVRGPVFGYVRRENVLREFEIRGFVEHALVNTSRQLDNETLDAVEPFDLSGLKRFEHGYLGGRKVKLADLSGAKRERRALREAGRRLTPTVGRTLHTQGVRVNLTRGDLMELPVLLPVYVLKIGRRLAVVNGQTGRVAVKTDREQKRSLLWLAEPAIVSLLVWLLMWAAVGSPWIGLIATIPLMAVVQDFYSKGRFSLVKTLILKGNQKKALRVQEELRVRADDTIPNNPFAGDPVFRQQMGDQAVDVSYRFFPPGRIFGIFLRTVGIFFLPAVCAAVLHFGFHVGEGFSMMGGVPWFWLAGIFCAVYFFAGGRQDAYEKPYVYRLRDGKRAGLLGSRKDRRMGFCETVGFSDGLDRKQKRMLFLIGACIFAISVFVILAGRGS